MFAWTDKVVVITGAASGIGEALARDLAARGCKLMLCDIDSARLQAVHDGLAARGATVRWRSLDVASLEGFQHLAQEVKALWGAADVVVNNAGVSLIEPFKSMAVEDAQWIMGINFWGVFHGCKAFLPQMQAQQSGHLVNISSIFAMVSLPTQSLYNASKAAVRGFSDSIREELRGSGIQVLCVHPGGIKTRIVDQARFGDISEVKQSQAQMKEHFAQLAETSAQQAAAQIVAAIESGKARLLIGRDAKLLDWIFRCFPASASKRFTKIMEKRRDQWLAQHNKPST